MSSPRASVSPYPLTKYLSQLHGNAKQSNSVVSWGDIQFSLRRVLHPSSRRSLFPHSPPSLPSPRRTRDPPLSFCVVVVILLSFKRWMRDADKSSISLAALALAETAKACYCCARAALQFLGSLQRISFSYVISYNITESLFIPSLRMHNHACDEWSNLSLLHPLSPFSLVGQTRTMSNILNEQLAVQLRNRRGESNYAEIQDGSIEPRTAAPFLPAGAHVSIGNREDSERRDVRVDLIFAACDAEN